MARSMEITTPLGEDVLLFHRMRAREELGRRRHKSRAPIQRVDERKRFRLPLPVHRSWQRRAVPVAADHTEACRARAADGDRGRPCDEIYADKYGRVKLQFHLDRHGRADEKTPVGPAYRIRGQARTGPGRDPAHRAGGDRRLSGRRSRSSDHYRTRLQRRTDAAYHLPDEMNDKNDDQVGIHPNRS